MHLVRSVPSVSVVTAVAAFSLQPLGTEKCFFSSSAQRKNSAIKADDVQREKGSRRERIKDEKEEIERASKEMLGGDKRFRGGEKCPFYPTTQKKGREEVFILSYEKCGEARGIWK